MPHRKKAPKVGVQALIVRDGKLLVVVKQYSEGTAYILPGGGQEHGETLSDAVRRECEEEIGVSVEVEKLLFVRKYIGANHQHAVEDGDIHIVNIIFACRVPEDYHGEVGASPDADQVGVTWLPLDELSQYRFFPASLRDSLMDLDQSQVYLET